MRGRAALGVLALTAAAAVGAPTAAADQARTTGPGLAAAGQAGAAAATPILAAAAGAQAPDLERARAELAAAARALEAAGSDTRLAALGAAVQAQETALAALHAGLRDMAAREAAALAAIRADRGRLAELVAALQSLSRAPRSALLAYPGGPVRAARAADLMAAITPTLDARLVELGIRLDGVRALRAEQEAARIEARAALGNLQDLRRAAAGALDARPPPARAELAAIAAAARAQAGDLGALARALGPGDAPAAGFAGAALPLPVAGTVVGRFGDPDPWGRSGRGWTLAAPAFAQVSAPVAGTVRYAGPLIDYGLVIVLEPEHPYLIVLAGLARTARLPGESVLAGEPLGDLGGPIPASEEFLLEATSDSGQLGTDTLYIEIRHAGNPVDPATWFGGIAPTQQ